MKILFAECCRELVVPYKENNKPRWCTCGQSAVWWRVSFLGHLGVFNKDGNVSVLGIHNGLLNEPTHTVSKAQTRRILDETPDNYLFKTNDSLIIRVFPGVTGDIELFTTMDNVPGKPPDVI